MDITEKRFFELAERAARRNYVTFSDFLNIDEKSLLEGLKLPVTHRLFGGYDGAERCVAAFGDGCDDADFPISIIKARPAAPKFADELTHRDFLGSLMGLGIKREVLGDIVIAENTGYIFCLESIAQYILQNLDKVRHTSVRCEIVEELPETARKQPEEKRLTVASERLDAVVAAVWGYSRNAVKEYFIGGRIFVNNRLCENFSHIPKNGDIISVRGTGRFVYHGVHGSTKKNRLVISVGIYK